MKRFAILTITLIAVNLFGSPKKNSREMAQSDPESVTVGEYSFTITEDPDSSMDLLTVKNANGEKICSYLSNGEDSERFLFSDPDQKTAFPYVLNFTSAPNRFFVTEWSLPSSAAKTEIKLLDISQRGGTCVFVGSQRRGNSFLGLSVNLELKEHDTLKVTEVFARVGETMDLYGKVSNCKINSKKSLVCKESKPTPYLPDNP